MDVILLFLSTNFHIHQKRPVQLLLLQIHPSLRSKENWNNFGMENPHFLILPLDFAYFSFNYFQYIIPFSTAPFQFNWSCISTCEESNIAHAKQFDTDTCSILDLHYTPFSPVTINPLQCCAYSFNV